MTGRGKLSVLTAIVACLAMAGLAAAAQTTQSSSEHGARRPAASSARRGRSSTSSTSQFDNVHFLRDNPNVPSDLEQMPNLLNFIKDNGTLDTNDHTVLISHTGGGILSSLTGLYPDRHGQARLELVRLLPAGRLGRLLVDRSSTGRTTPTAATRRTTRRPRLPTRTTTWSTTTRRRSAARAPPATRRRRGCRTRAPAATSAASALANIELENNTAIINRSTGQHDARGRRRRRATTNITVASAANLAAGQTIILETGTARAEVATITVDRRAPTVSSRRAARERAQLAAARSPSTPPIRPAT